MTTMMKLLLLCLLAATPMTVQASSTKTTYFKLTSGPSCNNGVTFKSVSAACDGSNCKLGDDLTATGTVRFQSAVPDTVCMTTTACFLGIQMDNLCRTYEDKNVDLCSVLNLNSVTGSNGNSCPAADAYSFESRIDIPGEESSIGSGWWVTAYTVVNDCNGSTFTECTTKIKAVGNRTMTYTGATAAAALCVGALALVFMRRRRVGKIDLAHEEAQAGHFEMMSDHQAV